MRLQHDTTQTEDGQFFATDRLRHLLKMGLPQTILC